MSQQRPVINLSCCLLPACFIAVGVYIFSTGGFSLKTVLAFVGYTLTGIGALIAHAGFMGPYGRVEPSLQRRARSIRLKFSLTGIGLVIVGIVIVNLPSYLPP